MFHRLLLIALTSIAAGGLGVPASARPAVRSRAVWPLAPGDLVAQLDNSDADSPTPAASPAVQSLQNRLGQLGYYEGAADGVFNPATSAALKAFQQNNGLVGTGILDPLTEERLLDRDAVPANIDGAAADAAEPAVELPEPTDESTDEPTDDEPTDELTSPAAESDERSAPPADTDPESISEAAGAEGAEAPAEEVPASDAEGETFSLEGSPTEGADGDPEAAAPAETAAPPESEGGLFRLALLGTIIMAVGALGTGVVLWLARQKAQKAAALEEQAPGSQASDEQALNDQAIAPSKLSPVPVVKPPAPSPAPQYGQNGQPPAVSETAQLSVNSPAPALSLSAMPESRVTKVNIVDELIQDLQESDPVRRRKSIWELGQRGNSAAVQPLANLLTDADSAEQGLILAALAEISTKTLKPMNRAMAMALQDDNPEVRKNAIRDLTRIYDSLGQVGRMLGQASADDDPEVRQTANWALDQLNKMRLTATDTARSLQDSRPPLEQRADDESSSHRA